MNKTDSKPRTKFCWHCARQLRGNFYSEYTAPDGNIYVVHKDCKEILEGGFNHKLAVDEDPDDGFYFGEPFNSSEVK